MLCYLCERVEVRDNPGEDIESVASGENVDKREERDGESNEDEVPDNQGGQKLLVDWLELQVEMQ